MYGFGYMCVVRITGTLHQCAGVCVCVFKAQC